MESTKNHERIELDYFTNKKIASLYVCEICLAIPNPLLAVEHADCGKIFCLSCISHWIKNQKTCPNCKKAFKSTQLSLALKRSMLNIAISCPNVSLEAKECQWEGEWEQLPIHERECPYAMIPCPNECEEEIRRKELTDHISASCANKMETCKFCKKAFSLKIFKAHEDSCELNMDAVVPCKYAKAGCIAKLKRRDQPSHDEALISMHMKLLVEHNEHLSKMVEELKKAKNSQAKCKQGHPLKFVTRCNYATEYNCDTCVSECKLYINGSWNCEVCDFDMCNVCYYNKHVKR
eukprot:TRINITY_DN17669_c0_g1_i1.p1 TRINITY_DN17669_c0_g1~~TRINITY_DN17669_c0_g1_i1.p1  ORF type:complete len:292 (+),score=44.21 TRINITY_DN17669_c0_g1_i1:93-968(+)